jgi:RNA polymerase sigma-70 factor (ECF subfamily)
MRERHYLTRLGVEILLAMRWFRRNDPDEILLRHGVINMSDNRSLETGATTREFFRNPTEAGWNRFVDRYGPQIYDWCRKRLGLARGLAEDVAQTVIVTLFTRMQAGRSGWDPAKGSLHAWLRTVVRNACQDALQKHRPAVPLQEADGLVPDFVDRIALEEVHRLALERTQARVTAREWEVFTRMFIEDDSGERVAEQTGMKIGTVYNYNSNATRVFREELKKLEDAVSP